MQLDLFVAGSDQVVDDVGRRGIATSAAEPFAASQTSHDGAWVVNTTIASRW